MSKFKFSLLLAMTLSTRIVGMEQLTLNDMDSKGLRCITRYQESLPSMIEGEQTLSERIMTYLSDFNTGIDLSIESRTSYKAMMEQTISRNDVLRFVILGFPCKSKNTDAKVITDQFDLGDYAGLVTLQTIAKTISSVYAPGCLITIINREPYIEEMGRITLREIGVNPYPSTCIDAYEKVLQTLIPDYFPNLCLGENFDKPYEVAYANVSETSDEPDQDVVTFYSNDLNTKEINSKISERLETEFMEFNRKRTELATHLKRERKSTRDLPAPKKLSQKIINEERRAIAKLLAKERMKGSEILRRLVLNRYNDYLRLSIRGSTTKMGIQIIYRSPRTPWHMTPFITLEGDLVLKDKATLEKEAEKKKSGSATYGLDSIAVEDIVLSYAYSLS